MKLKKTIAVVTGGAGFIGSHVVDALLAEGAIVRVIDDLSGGRQRNLEQHRANSDLSLDIRDIRSLTPNDPIFKGAESVFHFAGIGDIVPSIERPTEYMSVNVQGTVHVLEAARGAGSVRKLVYAASSSCYGLAETPTKLSAKIQPQYPYALSKYLGERAVLHWGQVYKLPACSVRIFNAYGPRARTSGAYGGVFGVFLRQKLAGRPLTVVGDGSQTRDFIYVTDVAQAFLAAARAPANGDMGEEVYNVGAGKPQSVLRIAELLGGGITHIPKRPGEPDCTWADISETKARLGWEPKVAFEDGVKAMLDRIDDWRDAPLWDKDSIKDATATWFKYLKTP